MHKMSNYILYDLLLLLYNVGCVIKTQKMEKKFKNYGIPFLLLKANWRYFPRLHNSLKSWTLNNCIYL